MGNVIRIGTRESQLAVWQATQVQQLLTGVGTSSELVYIKSEGDIDLKTPLYEMGVQGIFTKELDIALLDKRIDIAVHSLKDVPTQPARGIILAAILKRGPVEDLLVFKDQSSASTYSSLLSANNTNVPFKIATSSVRRRAQWLHRFPGHQMENLRGNVNTRLRKVSESDWNGAIFARAGLERIDLRPKNSIVLEWMLPAPGQGAITIASRETDTRVVDICNQFNHQDTSICTAVEREFLRVLMGGCSTPISGFAEIINEEIYFKGNVLSVNGAQIASIEQQCLVADVGEFGARCAQHLLEKGGREIVMQIRNAAN
ncbi:MAG: hydroxymethylbilane synthase [Chitinophagaceae bacterium]|nr:hydroxymethylbilane synthase [Chitinophagaceae bacterium]